MKRLRILAAIGMAALTLSLASAGVQVRPAAAQGYPWGGGSMGYGGPMGFGGPMGLGGSTGFGGSTSYQQPTAYATAGHVRLYLGDGAFFPSEISVPVYTQVSWFNGGSSMNTVTAPGIWDSGPIKPGDSWTAIFAVPGVFDYVSKLDPNKSGRIIVTP
jgi:plastocyanin